MTCKCNCHDPYYREANDEPEHANCEECRKAMEEETSRFAEIEAWYDGFIASGGQRPFRSTRHD